MCFLADFGHWVYFGLSSNPFFNYNKCKHLHIGNHELNFEYYMSTASETFKIQNVKSENDLGLTVDRGLKFSEHINKKISKANKILGLIFAHYLKL